MYDLQSGALLTTFRTEDLTGKTLDVGISPDGSMVVTTIDASGDANYVAHIWRIERQ